MQLPKSTAENPFLSCSFGFISSTEYIIAIKSVPLIISVELTNEEIFFMISFLNSDIEIIKLSGMHSFFSSFNI